MARKQSAGALLYRLREDGMDVLLVHPSGNYNRRAPWSIPKGLPELGEALEAAARRETEEETGIRPDALSPLGYIDYKKSYKRIHAFAGPAPRDAEPRCASWEIDRAEFLPMEEAWARLHPDQGPFLERLVSMLIEPREKD